MNESSGIKLTDKVRASEDGSCYFYLGDDDRWFSVDAVEMSGILLEKSSNTIKYEKMEKYMKEAYQRFLNESRP